MTDQSFGSYVATVRDKGRTIYDSWQIRFGYFEEGEPYYLEVSTIVPLERLAVDDLMWLISGAVLDTEVTHVVLHIWPAGCVDPSEHIEALLSQLALHGFAPFDVGWSVFDEDGQNTLVFSIFSKEEAERVLDEDDEDDEDFDDY